MTTLTARRTNSPNALPLILIVLSALCIFAVTFAPVYHQHATARHGTDAEQVRRCIEGGGTQYILQKMDSSRNHLLCTLPDGRIGDQVVQLDDNGVWHEITSFVRNESTMDDVLRALAREARIVWAK